MAGLPEFVDEFEALLSGNEILMARTQGVGILRPELAVNAGVTGPMLRGSGVNYDIRKVDHYGIYDRFKFRVPLGDHGDVYDRYMVRILEMRESIGILEQALKEVPAGPIMDPKAKIRGFRPEAWRGVWTNRSAQGRTGLLSDQRRRAESISLSRAAAEPDQSDRARRYVPGAERGGRGADFWKRGYCVGGSGSVREVSALSY